MLIYWQLDELQQNEIISKASLNFISQTLGLFTSSSPEEAHLNLRISSSCSEQLLNSALHLGETELLRKIIYSLEFQNKPETENNRMPCLDELIKGVNKKITDYCEQRNIPFIRKLPWSAGKPFAVALTHDVDLSRKYGLKRLGQLLLSRQFKESKNGAIQLISRKNSYWTFPEIIKLYRKKHWKATFYFLARIREDCGFRYNINSPKFRSLFRDLLSEGHEIGLHTSKYAFDYPQRIVKEKKRLEKVLGIRAEGVRQHYLRLQFPEAWQIFEEAGFNYDTSSGFSEYSGFRAGTSFPFAAFNSAKNKLYQLYEIPFSIMDYSCVHPQDSEENNWQRFLEIAENVGKVGGLLNILWHPSNLAEPLFRPYWERMLEWLEQQDFYQDTLQGIIKWWKMRNQVNMKEVLFRDSGFDFTLSSEENIQNLALEIHSAPLIISEDKNVHLSRIDRKTSRVVIHKLNSGHNKFHFNYA